MFIGEATERITKQWIDTHQSGIRNQINIYKRRRCFKVNKIGKVDKHLPENPCPEDYD